MGVGGLERVLVPLAKPESINQNRDLDNKGKSKVTDDLTRGRGKQSASEVD